jgi:hypothetical protein
MNKITRIIELKKLVNQYGGKIELIALPSEVGFHQYKVNLDPKASLVDSFAEYAYQMLGFFYEGGNEPDTYERNGSEFIFAI